MALSRQCNVLMFSSCSPEKRIRKRGIWGDGPVDDAESSSKVPRERTPSRSMRKVWVTPTIEEAEATEVTAKTAANAETTFSKNGS